MFQYEVFFYRPVRFLCDFEHGQVSTKLAMSARILGAMTAQTVSD